MTNTFKGSKFEEITKLLLEEKIILFVIFFKNDII